MGALGREEEGSQGIRNILGDAKYPGGYEISLGGAIISRGGAKGDVKYPRGRKISQGMQRNGKSEMGGEECLRGKKERRIGVSSSFLSLSPPFPPDVDLAESNTELWLGLLQDALTNHVRAPPLQEAACRCLARLLEVNPYLHLSIGEGTNQ